jgi:hypothetical protein
MLANAIDPEVYNETVYNVSPRSTAAPASTHAAPTPVSTGSRPAPRLSTSRQSTAASDDGVFTDEDDRLFDEPYRHILQLKESQKAEFWDHFAESVGHLPTLNRRNI